MKAMWILFLFAFARGLLAQDLADRPTFVQFYESLPFPILNLENYRSFYAGLKDDPFMKELNAIESQFRNQGETALVEKLESAIHDENARRQEHNRAMIKDVLKNEKRLDPRSLKILETIALKHESYREASGMAIAALAQQMERQKEVAKPYFVEVVSQTERPDYVGQVLGPLRFQFSAAANVVRNMAVGGHENSKRVLEGFQHFAWQRCDLLMDVNYLTLFGPVTL